jgi:hypothetical protein
MGIVDRAIVGALEVAAKTPTGQAALAAAETAAKEVFGSEGGAVAHKILGKLTESASVTDSILPNVSIAATDRPVYKVLVDGRSPWLPDGGKFPLPTKTADGWTPGEWIEHTPNTQMAKIVDNKLVKEGSTLAAGSSETAGIYVTANPSEWVSPAIWANGGRAVTPTVYEVEMDAASNGLFNNAAKGLNDLRIEDFAAGRIRLLRPIEEGENSALSIIDRDIKSFDTLLDDAMEMKLPIAPLTAKLKPLNLSRIRLTDDIDAALHFD